MNILDSIRLLFRKDKKPYLQLKEILGFYPHNIKLYRLALQHKSVAHFERERNEENKKNNRVVENKDTKKIRKSGSAFPSRYVNNERLEFLGDAILGAIVADILYKHYAGKQEGFLTTLRSKIVCRKSLNKLAVDIGLDKLVHYNGAMTTAHNSFMNGNAFEAFFGAIYLDRGYSYCYKFMEERIFRSYINVDEVARQEENFKSNLIEWSQRYQYKTVFTQQEKRDGNVPMFVSDVRIEGVFCGRGEGYSKKESDQAASKEALRMINKDKTLAKRIKEAKDNSVEQSKRQAAMAKTKALVAGRKVVVFDLDGTLLDTLKDLAESTNYALRECGFPERSIDEVRQFVGNGVGRLIQAAVPEGTDEETTEKCLAVFKAHYVEHCQDNTCLYNGVGEMLSGLKNNGCRLAIVSNKLQEGVNELYEAYFKDTVEVAVGERPDVRRKPEADMVEKALAELGVQKEEAVYVGDSDVDINTAANAGLPCISVSWGFRDKEFLYKHGATLIVERPQNVLDVLK
jgi:2-phosphoglycolate phosphatase